MVSYQNYYSPSVMAAMMTARHYYSLKHYNYYSSYFFLVHSYDVPPFNLLLTTVMNQYLPRFIVIPAASSTEDSL